MKYFSRIALCVGLATLASGCATVTGGTTEKLSVKTQKDSVDIAGATCTLANAEGSYQVTTPGKVSVRRAKDDLSIRCTKDGEAPASTAVPSSTRKGALAGDIAWLGVLSFVTYGVDRATGSIFAYPDEITVSFGEPAQQQQPAAKPTASAMTDSPASTETAHAQVN
jgi:hypothetical protein